MIYETTNFEAFSWLMHCVEEEKNVLSLNFESIHLAFIFMCVEVSYNLDNIAKNFILWGYFNRQTNWKT